MTTIEKLSAALLDRYEIEREIGAGGMANVYLARDVRHDRQVAVKVLRAELAAAIGAERFLLEIKVTANLQHPHILPLHDSGQVDEAVFYVMPYVEGRSLRALLDDERQLSIDAAVRIASEVASALDHAHRHGVIHRDIKPENILLQDGTVLVSDFGIALAINSVGGRRLTETGFSLGTPSYMSPEQAMSEPHIGARSDIYALGCVLYEMLIGEPPFTGPSSQAVIARMMTEEPRSPSLQRRTIPPHVEQALLTALARLPADRFASAAQFADALQGRAGAVPALAARAGPASNAARLPTRWSRLAIGASLVAAAVAGAAGAWAWFRPAVGAPATPMRFALALPPSSPLAGGLGSQFVLSPDGYTLVYAAQTAGSSVLARRDAGQLAPAVIEGTEQAALPFLSPDGKWVAFFAGNELRKVPIDGGPSAVIGTMAQPLGASWGPNNIIVLGSYLGVDGLSRIASSGGAPKPFTRPDSANGELSQRWPLVLADGKTVLYTSWGRDGLTKARIGVASLETGKCTILDVAGSSPLGIVGGQLIFARADGALMAAPFDLRHAKITGEAFVVVEGVEIGAAGASKAALSKQGALAYVTGSGASRLVLVNTNGAAKPLLPVPRVYDSPRFSPDGARVAVTVGVQPPDVWVYHIAAGTFTRLTSEGTNLRPEWTPDGKEIVFVSNRSGEFGTWWRDADGAAPPEKDFESKDDAEEVLVAPDGRVLVYRRNQTGGTYGVWFSSLKDVSAPRTFVTTSSYRESMPSLSPDGHWLAHVSNETGASEVYVRAFPGPGARYPVSAGGGSEPRWAPDGRTLFYRSERAMIAAHVSVAPQFAVIGRDVLFEGDYLTGAGHQSYDVSRDGRAFLMLQRETSEELIMVLNWSTELRAKMRARSSTSR